MTSEFKNIIHRFAFREREFIICAGQFESEGTEYLQLEECMIIEVKASAHFALTDSSFNRPRPIVFATRSKDSPEPLVSMQYEGLPLEILNRFLIFVEERWPRTNLYA